MTAVTGRNDPCPCGSGKRFKHCHGALGAMASTGPEARFPAAGNADPSALVGRGMSAHQRGDLEEAERNYRAALERVPDEPHALHFLGVIAYQRGKAEEALPLLERAATLVPAEPEFHNNLGLALAALERNEDAIAAYRRALALSPKRATAWNNLGLALTATHALPAAIDAFRHALASTPTFAQAHWNLALALLARGEYAEGWREYEYRLALPELGGRAPMPESPRWDGSDPAGKTLLLIAEQGLGDAIQFARFAPLLAAQGARVLLQAPPALVNLLSSVPGVSATHALKERWLPHDVHLPLLSIPGALGIDESTLPANVPYLTADRERRARVGAEVARHRGDARAIGIAWCGARNQPAGRRRSVPLELLTRLLAPPGVRWFSLQRESDEEEVARLPAARALIRLEARNDIDGTAALIDALDLVVSIDTSIAHIAGALGKRVFVLLPFAADWRWGVDRSTSPWYPTAQLVRQPRAGDWTGVVDAVVEAMERESSRHR